MSILTRIATLISANINAMIDAAEDPEKMVEEYLRQMRAELSEARAATAMAMADETRLRSQYERHKSEADEWQRKAEIAVQRDDDELAREALLRRANAQKLVDSYYAQWDSQHDQVQELREALAKLEAKIAEAESKRDLIIAKNRRAATQEAITSALQSAQGRPKSSGSSGISGVYASRRTVTGRSGSSKSIQAKGYSPRSVAPRSRGSPAPVDG